VISKGRRTLPVGRVCCSGDDLDEDLIVVDGRYRDVNNSHRAPGLGNDSLHSCWDGHFYRSAMRLSARGGGQRIMSGDLQNKLLYIWREVGDRSVFF
jgi:hypothetical protein